MTNINEVYFERVFNLGNYETFRLGLRANQKPEEVVKELDEMTVKIRNKRNESKH